MSKSFAISLPHYQFVYHFTFFKIDSWDDEFLIVKVDNVIKTQISYSKPFDTEYDRNFCGNSHNDHVEDVFQIVPYSYVSSSPQITITSTINEPADNESWGLNNFHMFYFLCYPSCKTCNGETSTNCQSCYDFATVVAGECKCNDGYYMIIPRVPCTSYPCSSCGKCDSTCAKCTGPSSTECTGCPSDRYLSGTTCISCLTIHCTKCTSNTNCQSCELGYALDGILCKNYCSSNKYKDASGICQNCDSTCLTCMAGGTTGCQTCSSDRYLSSSNSCLPCNSNCKTCTSTSTKCLTCNSPKILSGSACVDSCGTGYYQRSDSTCQPCNPSCLECNSATVKGCTKCIDGQYLVGGSCISCDIRCKTCETNPTNCNSCSTTTYLSGSTCVSICPDGKYPRTGDNTCQSCDLSCLTCTGSTSSSCKTCPDGKYLTSTNQCQSCNSNCKTCDLLVPTKCLSCTSPLFLSLTGNKCISPCPDGQYGRTTDQTCQKCDSTCITCNGGSLINCLSCEDGKFLYLTRCLTCDSNCKTCVTNLSSCTLCTLPLVLLNAKCIDNCPNGYFKEISSNSCQKCDSNCVTCSSSSKNCETCKSNQLKTTSNTCQNCDINCLTCLTSLTNCQTCATPLFFENNKCVTICIAGFYGDLTENKCKPCDSSCVTCSGKLKTDCKSCVDKETVAPNGECKQCDSACKTCRGMTANECLSCDSNLYFVDSSCKDKCPNGYYPVENPIKVCLMCDIACSTCISGSQSDCTKCNGEYYFKSVDTILKTGQCLKVCEQPLVSNPSTKNCEKNCDSNQYLDKKTNICGSCNTTCLTCIGPSGKECTSCASPNFLFSLNCVNNCSNGYYPDPNKRLCNICSSACINCKEANSCVECASDVYLDVTFKNCTKCETKGYYIDKNEKTCNPCYFSCLKCISTDTCLECDSNTVLKLNKCYDFVYVKPNLIADENISLLYYLNFNNTFPEFFNNMTSFKDKYPKISLNNLDPSLYSYFISLSPISLTTFEILLKMNPNNINISSEIIVELNPDEEKYYKFTDKILRLPVSETKDCSLLQFYNKSSMKCQDLQIISPFLVKTTSPLNIKLIFSDNFLDLFKIISNVSNISISDMPYSSFNYSITATNTSKIFDINLNFSQFFSSRHYLTLTFILPPSLSNHPKQRLNPENVSLEILPNLKKIEFLSTSSDITSLLFIPLSFITGISTYGAISFNGVLAVYLIRYLKYIDIEYPREALEVFVYDLGYISFLPSLKTGQISLEIEQPDRKFQFYNVKAFILDNCEGKLLEIAGLFVVGLVIKIIYYPTIMQKLGKVQFGFGRKLFQMISLIFYFNLVIIVFIFHYMDLILFSLLNIKWKNLDSDTGLINFCVSIGFLCFSILTLLSFSSILLKLRRIFKDIRHHIKNNIPFNSIDFQRLEEDSSTFKISPDQSTLSQKVNSNSINILDKMDANNKEGKTNKNSPNKERIRRNEWWNNNNKIEIDGLSNNSDILTVNDSPRIIESNKANAATTSKKEVPAYQHKNVKEDNYDWRRKYDSYLQYSILWKQFRKRQKNQILFPVANMIRCFIVILILVFLSNHSFLCASAVLGINGYFFIYFIIAFPFKKFKDWILQFFLETCVIVATGNAFWIAYDEYFGNTVQSKSAYRGWFIFYSNLIAIYVSIICYGFHFLYWVINYIVDFKKNKKNKVKPEPIDY